MGKFLEFFLMLKKVLLNIVDSYIENNGFMIIQI